METKNRFYISVAGVEHEVIPHYKKLEKKYKKENNQAFFRESLDGQVVLWGTGYKYIRNASLEDTLLFKVYRNNVLYASASFNKSDCKFDHFKHNVELNLKYDDKYSKILDAYENTYDLIKLAPAITPLILTKRSVVQIYIQGENVVSNFSGGTYWETTVNEPVDDEDALTRTYFFSKGPKFIEINLQGFNYNINGSYRGLASATWNASDRNNVVNQLTPVSEIGGKFFYDDGPRSNRSFMYKKYEVESGNLYAFSSYFGSYTDINFLYWIDANDGIISKEPYKGNPGSGSDPVHIVDQGIIAPNNARYACINVLMSRKQLCILKFVEHTNNTINKTNFYGSIIFSKVKNKDSIVTSGDKTTYTLGDGITPGTTNYSSPADNYYLYDTYEIQIWTGKNGTGVKIYSSDYWYGNDSNFLLSAGDSLYPMRKLNFSNLVKIPEPNTFNLGSFIIEYQIWGRLLCDVDVDTDGTEMYDLPYDDFATQRKNYKKCIGLQGFNLNTSLVKIFQNQNTSESPTAYGMNDFREYFLPPASLQGQYFYPLSRSTWANTSLWVMLDETLHDVGAGFEVWNAKHYKEYTLKNSYHIADVIKMLLAEIDPSISHEKSSTYSQFLYGHSGATAQALGGCDVYITQKTNILKGEYDQAAQKAEIKFKQVMDMLRDCFRCYWFIDSQNRFRVEHISYFMKGQSYSQPITQIDLTENYDKFNRLQALFMQQKIEFDKSELTSRYEFAWMDDVTNSMGNLQINILNQYIQKDKSEEINIDGFTSDVDYMLFLPDNFSDDGFALLLADSTNKVPIEWKKIKDEKQFNRSYDIFPQNWYASFNQLIRHYMLDMPGDIISYNNLSDNESLYVSGIKKCMKQEIEFPASGIDIDINKLIATEIGNGYIEEMSVDIDTDMAKIELSYEPQ